MNISAFECISTRLFSTRRVQHIRRIHQILPAFDLVNQTIKFSFPRGERATPISETRKNSYILANGNGVSISELRSGDNRLLIKFGVTGRWRALRLRYSERAALRHCITVLPFTAGMVDLLASLGRLRNATGN